MADTLTARHGDSNNPIKAKTAVHIDLVGSLTHTPLYTPAHTVPTNGDTGPSQPELTYHILVDAPAGVDDARSPSFQPSSDYKWTWDGYIFPAAGSYSLKLVEDAGGTTVAALTTAVTVS